MRKAGLPKPDGVTWPQWVGPKKLNHRHKTIALLAAQGLTQQQIMAEVGVSQSRLSIIMNSERMKAEIARCARDIYGADAADRFRTLSEKSLKVAEDILDNVQERSSLRYQVAKDFIDRHHGKAPERLEIKNNTIRELFEALDRMSLGRPQLHVHQVVPAAEVRPINVTPQAEVPAELAAPAKRDEYDDIDSWIEANVPRSKGVGTKE